TTSVVRIALVWRILNATATCTFFQPDEFFQSLEVAHRTVFGYGHLTWEWTASPPIRSILFPALYMPVYWVLKIIAPKVFQGAIAAITDIGTRELARQILGERYANAAYFLSLTSFFHMLALCRTLSNSVETSLTTAALCFWPWHSEGHYGQIQPAFALAAISCMIRPTSAIIWAFLFAELVWRMRNNARHLKRIFLVSLVTAAFASSFLLFIDSCYFGKPIFTPLNFVLTNLSSISSFYGQSPWHYYLTQGLPILLNISLPYFAIGVWSALRTGPKHQNTLLSLILWTITVYSFLGHKEWRFIHPLLPLTYVISAKSLVDYDYRYKPLRHTVNPLWSGKLAILLLGGLSGIYVMRFHGSAQVDVILYLKSLEPSVLRSAGFLMPCHSTPWQAFLHKPHLTGGRLWALGCEPPLSGQNSSTYRDQTEMFYVSPIDYLRNNFPALVDPEFPASPLPSTKPGSQSTLIESWEHRWPSHLIFFGALMDEAKGGDKIMRHLGGLGYSEVWAGSNGFEEDWRRRGGVKVWKWQRGMLKKENSSFADVTISENNSRLISWLYPWSVF
ncbi:Alg9-like mannosyltransferase family-domain-containing protein, partial [Phellopilus nigrolimitatus]